ncbi:MAG: hypothetical protein KDE14_12060 [Rhodobacteraceae bacterium]|nr:hypothetical protein [Paracoccaceae bacterium]
MKMIRAVLAALLLPLAANPAAAQSLSFTSKNSSSPIDVTADSGIEWQQTEKLFIARGNAKAVQDDLSVTADQLIAHYRDTDGGDTQVFRVDAIGSVTIASSEETATGKAAVYDFDKAVLVIEGDPVTLTTKNGTVTANDTIQYWIDESVAVADGDATARDEDRRIRADKLVAYFASAEKNQDGGALKRGEFKLVKGEGRVVLTTAKEVVSGDRGEYNLETGIAKLEGSVKMTKDKNQLSGGFATVDTKAGTSRLFGSAREAGVGSPAVEARVKALIAPKPETRASREPGATGG